MNLLTKVSKLMATDLITVTPQTSIWVAKELFGKHQIHHLPVVDNEGDLVGILSTTDLLKHSDRLKESGVTVGDIMTSKLAKLETDDTIRTAANLFTLNKFHALPVVDGSKVVGILTTLDLVKLMDSEEIKLEDYRNV